MIESYMEQMFHVSNMRRVENHQYIILGEMYRIGGDMKITGGLFSKVEFEKKALLYKRLEL